ncbi:MAG: Cna B-type domain-containing protein [Ruminococcus sp.]
MKAYAYYVVEPEISGWESSIAHNGQPVNGETATITVTNTKTIEKTSISVEKKWVDNDKAGASHGAVNVTLRRKLKSGTDYDKDFSETAELSSGNGWTHTWSSLDKTDAGGNQYLYDVVEENVPSGYQATYKNNNGVNGNTAENPIVIVNTKVLQLTLKKRWSDSDTNNHQNDPVEVRIYRSTNPAVVPVVTTATTKATTTTTTKATTTKATTTETTTKATTTTTTTTSAKETKPEETTTTTQPKLKLTAADNKTELLEKGGKLQLTADPSDGVTFKSSSDEIATVDSSGLVTGQKVGTVTITAHKDGYEDATIQLTVKDATKRVDVSNAAAGKKIKIKLTGGVANQTANGCYGYSYQDSGTWKWQQIYWEQTLDANGSAEWEYTVPNDFGNGFQIRVWWVGGMIPPVDESIKIEYTVEEVTTTTTTKPEETTTTTTTTPPPSSGDTVTGSSIVLEKDAHSVNLDSTKTVSKLELNISLTSTTHQWYNAFYFEFKKANQTIGGSVGFTWDFSNSSISEVNWNNGGGTCTINGASLTYVFTTPISTDKLEIVNGSKDSSIWMIDSYTITYATDTSAQSLAAPSAMRMLRMAANVMTSGSAGVELVDTVKLKGSDSSSWQAVRTNLPACDENGNPYYYWAEETAVGGYTPGYTYAGGADNYISGADGVITITNTKEESASVTMPATGGRGTRWYTITGAAILCGTAAGYLWFRRRYLSRVE